MTIPRRPMVELLAALAWTLAVVLLDPGGSAAFWLLLLAISFSVGWFAARYRIIVIVPAVIGILFVLTWATQSCVGADVSCTLDVPLFGERSFGFLGFMDFLTVALLAGVACVVFVSCLAIGVRLRQGHPRGVRPIST